ncbi:MAG: hypothetical protein WBA57_25165 [Elainellaceae cyanobacterium]
MAGRSMAMGLSHGGDRSHLGLAGRNLSKEGRICEGRQPALRG